MLFFVGVARLAGLAALDGLGDLAFAGLLVFLVMMVSLNQKGARRAPSDDGGHVLRCRREELWNIPRLVRRFCLILSGLERLYGLSSSILETFTSLVNFLQYYNNLAITQTYTALFDRIYCIMSMIYCCSAFDHRSDCHCRCRDLAGCNIARLHAEQTGETTWESGG